MGQQQTSASQTLGVRVRAVTRPRGAARQAAWALTADQVMDQCNAADVALVDLRDAAEREVDGVIPGSIHAPYTGLEPLIKPGGMLREMVGTTGRRLIYYCAYGERSAMAVESSQEMGLENVCHLVGGIDAWAKAGGPI